MGRHARIWLLAAVLFLPTSKLAGAATLALAWDRSPDPDVVGYVVRGGLQPGAYGYSLDVGRETTLTLPNLPDGLTLYIVVEAYAAGGRRSAPSNEIVWTGPSHAVTGVTGWGRDADDPWGSAPDSQDRFWYDATTGWWSLAADGNDSNGLWPMARIPFRIEVNGDGRFDVLLHDPVSGEWMLVVREGDTYRTVGSGVWAHGLRPLVSDLDGDGQEEVSLYDPEDGTALTCWRRNGPAAFTCAEESRVEGMSTFVVDLDGDRRADRLTLDRIDGSWTLALSSRGGRHEGSWSGDVEVHLGDLDADGATDLLLYRAASGAWIRWSAGTGTSGLWQPHQRVFLTDLTGDGRADALLTDGRSGEPRLAVGSPDGLFPLSPADARLRHIELATRGDR
jgi:hypothetical protein